MPSLAFTDFSGGLWIPADPEDAQPALDLTIPPNGLVTADNVEYLGNGGVRGRRGRVRVNSVPLPGPALALFRHYPREQMGASSAYATFAAVSGAGNPWQQPDKATGQPDLNETLCDFTVDAVSETLLLTFAAVSFGAPIGPAIRGIEFQVNRRAIAGVVRDASVRAVKNGVVLAADRARPSVNWGSAEFARYGSASDLWGTTWVNTDTIGVAIAVHGLGDAASVNSPVTVVAAIDNVGVIVYFSDATAARLLVAFPDPAHGGDAVGVRASVGGEFLPVVNGELGWLGRTDRPRFVNWPERGKTFVFTGAALLQYDSGTDAVTRVTAGPNWGVGPKFGPYATLWKERLFATDPNELSFSVYATDLPGEDTAAPETEWNPNLQLSVNDPAGGHITGVEALADRLVILKDTGLWAFVGDIEFGGQLVNYSERGCVAPHSVAVTPAGLVYLARDGLYLTDGADPAGTEISRPIRALFSSRRGVTTYPDAVGVYFPRKQMYLLKLSPAAADGWTVQLLDTSAGPTFAWAHVPVLPLNCATVAVGSGDLGELYLGGTDGLVRVADVGADDEGLPIVARLQTASRPLRAASAPTLRSAGRVAGADDASGRAYRVRAVTRTARPLDCGLRYDSAAADDVGFLLGSTQPPSVQHPRSIITDTERFGRRVGVRVENAGDGPEFELHEIHAATKMRSNRRWP